MRRFDAPATKTQLWVSAQYRRLFADAWRRPEIVSKMTQRFVRTHSDGWCMDRDSLLADNEDDLDAQERELRKDIIMVLRARAIYSRDELEDIMAALQRLGVKNTRHLQHIRIEDLTNQGVPVVTSRILLGTFGDKDGTAKGTEDGSPNGEPIGSWGKIWAIVTHPAVVAVLTIAVGLLRVFVLKV